MKTGAIVSLRPVVWVRNKPASVIRARRLVNGRRPSVAALASEEPMKQTAQNSDSFTWIALVFEGGLAVIAMGIGWALSFSPIEKLRLDAGNWWGVLLLGCAASLPLFAGLWAIEALPLRPLVHLREKATGLLERLLGQCTIGELAVISLFAGVGEEILFRGLLQDGIAAWIDHPAGVWLGLGVASIIFGLAHAATRTYAVLAALAGGYLGLLLIYTENLMVPILAHAVYDFGALVYVLKWEKNETVRNSQE